MTTEEKMTKKRAFEILRSGDTAHPDYEKAYAYLESNYPVEFEYLKNELAARNEEVPVEEELDAVETPIPDAPSEPVEKEVNSLDIILQNHKDLQELSNKYDMGKHAVSKYMKAVTDRVEIYEKDDKTGEEAVLSEDRKKGYLKLLFQETKLQVEQRLVVNPEFYRSSKEEKKEIFESLVDESMFANLSRAAMASDAPQVKVDEKGMAEVSIKEIDRHANKFREIFKNAIDGDKKIRINADAVLLSTAVTSEKTSSFVKKLQDAAKGLKDDAREKLNNVAAHFMASKNRLEEKASKISLGRYTKVIKPVVKGIYENLKADKLRMAANTAATVGLTLSGGGAVALGLYGAYMAAGSWGFPIVKEAAKIRQEAKKDGQKIPLGRRLKMARAKLKDNPRYRRQGWITTGLAVASFGTLSGLAAHGTNVFALGRGLMPLIRGGIANTVQATETALSGAAYLKHKGDEQLKKQFKLAAIGLGVGVVATAVAQYFAHDRSGDVAESTSNTQGGATTPEQESILPEQELPSSEQEGLAPVDTENTQEPSAEDLGLEIPEIEHFPQEWSEDMGISKSAFERMMSRINSGQVADVDPQSLDRAYLNMDEEFMSHFEGKTKMQVFYDMLELDRNGHRSQDILYNAQGDFYYIKTPTEAVQIEDEGIIKFAKDAYSRGEIPVISRLHGRDFLKHQFENLNIDGMTDAKMSQIVEIAMKTYDPNQVGAATAQIHEILPDLTTKELSKVSQIVNYNRAYEQNGEVLEKLHDAVFCNNKEGLDYKATNELVDQTQAILAQSNRGDITPEGRSVGCPDTVLHTRKIPQAPVQEPDEPEFHDEIEELEDTNEPVTRIPDEPIPVQRIERKPEIHIGVQHRITDTAVSAHTGGGSVYQNTKLER